MQVLQRSFSVLLVMFFLMFTVSFVFQERESNTYQQWQEIQISRFLQQVRKEGKCSYKQYQLFYDDLNRLGVTIEIVLKEYQRETDIEGKVYWYLISWEEIQECFIQKEYYVFQANSVVELCITTKKDTTVRQKKSYVHLIEK